MTLSSFTHCIRLIMLGTLLTLLSVSSFPVGQSRAICPHSTVEAEEGDNVTLQCYLDPQDSVVDYAVDWKRLDLDPNGLVVWAYRHKHENTNDQMLQYRNRTIVNLEGLNRGDMTVHIYSVQLNDSGQYMCFVPKLWTSCVLNLTVGTKDQQNRTQRDDARTTRPPLEEPDDPDSENMKRDVAIAVAIPMGLLIFIGVLVLVLVLYRKKRGSIHLCDKEKRKEPAAAGGCELRSLRTSSTEEDRDRDQDRDGPAADDLRNNEQVV